MKRSPLPIWIFGVLTPFALANGAMAQVATSPSPLLQNPIEVQPRGPIHEAYAQPPITQPGPTPIIPKAPPPTIPEEPPAQKPENAQWIPGYWSWDAERQDYIWVSGVYRVAPQGRTFVPGHWVQADSGYRWVAGFWTGQDPQNLPLTPQPPATLENGPSAPPPSDDANYIPGNWVYRGSSFAWQPGYYANFQQGRVWNPSSYNWTPNGYVYNDGYWDYPLDQRGLMFAPVYFNQPLWQNPNWAYQPNYPLGISALLNAGYLNGNRYYYGNYGGSNYARGGYRPARNNRNDPVFAYQNWQNQRKQANRSPVSRTATTRVVQQRPTGNLNQVRVQRASAPQVQRAAVQPIRVAPRPVSHVPYRVNAPHVVHAAPVHHAAPSHAAAHHAPAAHHGGGHRH